MPDIVSKNDAVRAAPPLIIPSLHPDTPAAQNPKPTRKPDLETANLTRLVVAQVGVFTSLQAARPLAEQARDLTYETFTECVRKLAALRGYKLQVTSPSCAPMTTEL
jgi:hypothetical protein